MASDPIARTTETQSKIMNPQNYKTQSGLIKALDRASEKPMTVSLAWWFKNAEWTLINKWGWKEDEAAKFVAGYKPRTSAYRANA